MTLCHLDCRAAEHQVIQERLRRLGPFHVFILVTEILEITVGTIALGTVERHHDVTAPQFSGKIKLALAAHGVNPISDLVGIGADEHIDS